jgi:mono/diheme cytochrome c family protein
MIRFRWFLFGLIAAGLLALAGGGLYLASTHGLRALERPGQLETRVARMIRSSAIPSDAKARVNPVANTPEVLAEARAHWADHCAGCHANDGSGEIDLGRRTYPPAPDMRKPATQDLSDGELFFIIQNGVRLTAMPGWGGNSSHGEEDSWKLVHFIRHLPQITAEEKKGMEKLNPKTPAEMREEEEEEQFLKGESHDPPIDHHHH